MQKSIKLPSRLNAFLSFSSTDMDLIFLPFSTGNVLIFKLTCNEFVDQQNLFKLPENIELYCEQE